MKQKFKFLLCTMVLSILAFTSCDRQSGKRDARGKEYSVYEVVAQRNAELQKQRVNNVYYNEISEPILISILNKIGTTVSRAEIVFEYESNISYYTGVAEGVKNYEQLTPVDLPEPPIKQKEEPNTPLIENN